MLVFFAATSAFVGIKLGQCWVILEERYPEYRGQVRDPYPSIAEKAAGKIGRGEKTNFVKFGCPVTFLIFNIKFGVKSNKIHLIGTYTYRVSTK